MTPLLHSGHLSLLAEAALVVSGSLAALAIAARLVWRPRPGSRVERHGRVEGKRLLRGDEANLLDEAVDGGA
jgi:hypothetical protein